MPEVRLFRARNGSAAWLGLRSFSEAAPSRDYRPFATTWHEYPALEFDLRGGCSGSQGLFIPLTDTIPSKRNRPSHSGWRNSRGNGGDPGVGNAEGRQRERWRSPELASECPRRPA
jgi:hypothetical protein